MKFLCLVILFYSSMGLATETPCNDFFEEVIVETEAQDATSELIAYLTRLLEENKIGEKELQRLTKGEAPITEEEAREKIEFKVFREDVETYFQTGQVDNLKIAEWSSEVLQSLKASQQSRNEVHLETESPYIKMVFNPLPKGRIKGTIINIRNPFEMTAYEVTQYQWFEVMGGIPNDQPGASESYPIYDSASGKSVKMNPNFPVTNISIWSAMVFANQLSKKHGYDPVYDLGDIEFKGEASIGNLTATTDIKKSLRKLIRKTNGYRLPLYEEWLYVISRYGEFKTVHESVDGHTQENRIETFNGSDLKLGAVGEYSPLMVNGHPFYDLVGNSWEITGSVKLKLIKPLHFLINLIPLSETENLSTSSDSFYYTRPLYFSAKPWPKHPLSGKMQADLDARAEFLGFRLARTLK